MFIQGGATSELVPDFLGFVLFFIAIGGIVTVVLAVCGWNGWKNYKGDF